MSSPSAQVSGERPFYAGWAGAYDRLIDDPAEPWADAVHQGLGGGAGRILDAGCGTGRHARALADLGHDVDLADASPALLAQAGRRCPSGRTLLIDLCTTRLAPDYAAVTCRGVLNDMITDAERAGAIACLAGALRPGGLLFLDVREAAAARRRADGTSQSKTTDQLTFTSRTTWSAGLLHVVERYEPPGETYHFRMRPWTVAELTQRLEGAGLRLLTVAPGVGRRTPDRLFVVAAKPGSP